MRCFPILFWLSVFFYFMQSRLCSFAPIFLFWNICLSAFFCQRFWKRVFFQQVFTFTGWNQDSIENLKYLLLWPTLMVLRVAHACSVPEFLWASVKQQGKETFWELSKEGDGYPHIQAILTSRYLICPILLIPTELSAITHTIHTWTVHHSGYWVLKMEL